MRLIDVNEAIINFGFEWDDIPPTREEFVRFLKKQPTVDAVPVVRGEWIDSPTGDYAICSHCRVEWNVFDNDTYRFRHCPACGAKMESEGST